MRRSRSRLHLSRDREKHHQRGGPGANLDQVERRRECPSVTEHARFDIFRVFLDPKTLCKL